MSFRRTTGPRLIAGLATGLLLVPAASAHAARYASPSSSVTSGTCSTEFTACALEYAVEGAPAGDEIVVLPGTYDLGTATLAPSGPVSIRGRNPAERPLIVSSPAPLTGSVIEVEGSTLQDLHVESRTSATAISLQESSTGERLVGAVTAAGAGADAKGVQLKNGTNTLRDSLALSNAPGGAALQIKDGTSIAVGVTAVGTGGADGLTTKTVTGSVAVRNSILTGSLDYESDAGAEAVISSSNWRRSNSTAGTSGAGNQTAAPAFCVGDALYRPGGISPTRDAGVPDAAAGTKDLAGAPRPLGDGVDIGAFEYSGCAVEPVAGGGGGGPDSDGDGIPDTSDATPHGSDGPPVLPPASEPVLGSTVKLGEVKGAPRVRLPGSRAFVALTQASTVPVGSVVDATRGTVELTVVRDRSGRLQTGTFWGGVFKVKQSRRDAVTELVLAGRAPGCRRAARRARTDVSASRSRRRWSRRLWGRDRGGRFRTRGRYGSATVRGTRWLTEDRCDGTLFKVTEGAIDVRDNTRRKTVRLKRGKSYLAKAGAAKKKRRR